jgi:excinuclease ABC subunit C
MMTVKNSLTSVGRTHLERGAAVIAAYVKTLPSKPGVYQMLDGKGKVLYVGKAKDLQKRVMSYTRPGHLSVRLQRMVSETVSMAFVTTETETEALLLEANFIKQHAPRYNVLLKDSKYFAYIALTHHAWPRLMKYRGPKNPQDHYFGPFASSEAIDRSLTNLYKLFKLRSCTDHFFATRKRPCMQYHIQRCSAPCVNYISPEAYRDSVRRAVAFLKGKSHQIQQELSQRMQEASQARDYERAALYRDQIKALTHLQAQQVINTSVVEDADIFGLYQQAGLVCLQIFFFRRGSNYGSYSLFPEHIEELSPAEMLSSILPVFYEDKDIPSEILLSHHLTDQKIIEQAFRKKAGHAVSVVVPRRGQKQRLVAHAVQNAREALERHLAHAQSQRQLLAELAQVLGLPQELNRIEVYDNSHIHGQDAVGAMIVVGPEGFRKKEYRKFTIRQTEVAGNDYGMMHEVLKRRFSGTLATDPDRYVLPDLLIIDGGQGQVNVAMDVLHTLKLDIPVLGIAKGPDRHAGRERFYYKGLPAFTLERHPNVLYFLQRIRDEAHRFAIGTYRAKHIRRAMETTIADIPGIGAVRKKALLLHFGSAKAIQNARVEDLEKVEGINTTLARKIYAFFHDV